MISCEKCGHKFSHRKMMLTMRYISCPSCDTEYKITVKNFHVGVISVVIAYFLLTYINGFLPGDARYLGYSLVIVILVVLSPLNLQLKPVEKDE